MATKLFCKLKSALTEAPILRCINPIFRCEFATDTSDTGIGATFHKLLAVKITIWHIAQEK